MKILINVYEKELSILVEQFEYDTNKKITEKKLAELFAQDLINRYFNIEYLDSERLEK